MTSCNPALLLVSVLAATVFGREKGFLAQDQEAKQWNAFLASEAKIQAKTTAVSDETRTVPMPRHLLGTGSDQVQAIGRAMGPGSPLLVNFSVNVMTGTMPCEKRLHDCAHEQYTCVNVLDHLKVDIKKAAFQLRTTADDHPLLNTLAIKSEVHRRSRLTSPPVPQGLVPIGQDPNWATRLRRIANELDRAQARPNFKAKTGIDRLVGSVKPLAKGLHPALSHEVANGIAEEIADALPNETADDVVKLANNTCTRLQTVVLNDCHGFVEACKQQLTAKQIVLKSFKARIRQRLGNFESAWKD